MAERTGATMTSTLLAQWAERLSQPRVLVTLSLLFILLLVGAAYLDGDLAQLLDSTFLRGTLVGPALFIYTLAVARFLSRFRDRAIEAFRPLLLMDHEDFDRLLAEASPLDPRREWLALGLGAAFPWAVYQPWGRSSDFSWVQLHGLLSSMLMFGFLAWISYRSLVETRLFAELQRQPLNIDIFDPTPLEPVARQSLASSLGFIGGITISLLFLPYREWLLTIQSFIVYGTLILVSVLVFFVTMSGTHQVMAEAKERELRLVRQNLSAAYQELKERAAQGHLQDMEALSDSITAWLAYEKRIKEAPEWPYTTDTLRNLVVSTLVPIVAWAAQVVVEFIT
jgi:hypothetical protein